EPVLTMRNEICTGPDAVAYRNCASAEHGFIDNDTEWFVFRGKDHKVGSAINFRQLRLVSETEKSCPFTDPQLVSLCLKFASQSSITGKNQVSINCRTSRERLQQILRSFPRLQFRAKQDHGSFLRYAPSKSYRPAIDCGSPLYPPIVVYDI